ncbi:hypothetical protein V8F33_003935 [Rhypophila sp. PSN 637]
MKSVSGICFAWLCMSPELYGINATRKGSRKQPTSHYRRHQWQVEQNEKFNFNGIEAQTRVSFAWKPRCWTCMVD